MYPNELCLHILAILLFTSSAKELATLLLNTIPDIITLLTPNDIHFVAVCFKLKTISSTVFDQFLFSKRSFIPKYTLAGSKLLSSNVCVT